MAEHCPPHLLEIMEREPSGGPLRRQLLPDERELERAAGETDDPLAEEQHTVAPGLIHRYRDRAVLLVTGVCAAYCRFCTRSRLAGTGEPDLEEAFAYLRAHPEVREVIVSGGDPLMLEQRRLAQILTELRSIAHLEVIRVGTRMPVFDPDRVTPELVATLAAARPLYVLAHVNHPVELTPGFDAAVGRLVDAGMPVLSQTVLLREVNDEVEILRALFYGLQRRRVMPYYLHQCDLVSGSQHFRVPIERGLRLVQELQDSTSGLCVPRFMLDLPDAGGKVALQADRIVARDDRGVQVRGVDGRLIRVPDRAGR